MCWGAAHSTPPHGPAASFILSAFRARLTYPGSACAEGCGNSENNCGPAPEEGHCPVDRQSPTQRTVRQT